MHRSRRIAKNINYKKLHTAGRADSDSEYYTEEEMSDVDITNSGTEGGDGDQEEAALLEQAHAEAAAQVAGGAHSLEEIEKNLDEEIAETMRKIEQQEKLNEVASKKCKHQALLEKLGKLERGVKNMGVTGHDRSSQRRPPKGGPPERELSSNLNPILPRSDGLSTRQKVADLIASRNQLITGDACKEDDDSSTSSDESSTSSRRQRRKGRRGMKSGILDSNKSVVVSKQKYPHAALRQEFLGGRTAPGYHKLPMTWWYAGELEIIAKASEPVETSARLDLLRKLSYKAEFVEFRVIRSIHEAVLSNIERGIMTWSSDFDGLIQTVLDNARHGATEDKRPLSGLQNKQDKGPKKKPKTWFCAKYNRGECMETETPHKEVLFGEERVVHHCCAKCMKEDGIQEEHPETADECPHRE